MAKEKNLTAVTSVAAADFARVVTSAGASVKATFANIAKYIIETYNGSTVAGSAQSVKSALDSLNSKTTASSFAVTCNSTYIDSFTNQSSVIGKVAVISMWWKFKSTSQIPASTTLFTLPNNATFAQRYYSICYDWNSNVYNILQSNANTSVVATRDNFTPPSTSAYFYTVMVCVLN